MMNALDEVEFQSTEVKKCLLVKNEMENNILKYKLKVLKKEHRKSISKIDNLIAEDLERLRKARSSVFEERADTSREIHQNSSRGDDSPKPFLFPALGPTKTADAKRRVVKSVSVGSIPKSTVATDYLRKTTTQKEMFKIAFGYDEKSPHRKWKSEDCLMQKKEILHRTRSDSASLKKNELMKFTIPIIVVTAPDSREVRLGYAKSKEFQAVEAVVRQEASESQEVAEKILDDNENGDSLDNPLLEKVFPLPNVTEKDLSEKEIDHQRFTNLPSRQRTTQSFTDSLKSGKMFRKRALTSSDLSPTRKHFNRSQESSLTALSENENERINAVKVGKNKTNLFRKSDKKTQDRSKGERTKVKMTGVESQSSMLRKFKAETKNVICQAKDNLDVISVTGKLMSLETDCKQPAKSPPFLPKCFSSKNGILQRSKKTWVDGSHPDVTGPQLRLNLAKSACNLGNVDGSKESRRPYNYPARRHTLPDRCSHHLCCGLLAIDPQKKHFLKRRIDVKKDTKSKNEPQKGDCSDEKSLPELFKDLENCNYLRM